MFGPARSLPIVAPLAWGAVAVAFACVLLAASDVLTPTWYVLIVAALGLTSVLALARSPRDLLFTGYIATVSVGISKGLVAGGGVYYPALYLTISDFFLLSLVACRAGDILIVKRGGLRWHPILSAAALWLGWQWISALHAPDLRDALLMALNQTKFFLALWLCWDTLSSAGKWRLVFRGVSVAVLAHAAMSALQIATGGSFELQGIAGSQQRTLSFASEGLLDVVRPSGLLTHPNLLADFLVLILPACLGLLLLRPPEIASRRPVWWAIALVALSMLLLTVSRGGWVALVVGVMTYIVLGYRRGLVEMRQARHLLVAGAALVVLSMAAYPALYLRLVQPDDKSTASRVLMAEQAVKIIGASPALGVGLTGYGVAAKLNRPASFGVLDPGYAKILSEGRVHNKYLLVTVESGLVGLLLFLNVFRTALRALWRASAGGERVRRSLLLGVMAGLVALLTTYLAEPAETGVVVEIAWIALGAAAALVGNASRDVVESIRPGAGSARC